MLFMTQKKLDRIVAEEREKIYQQRAIDNQLAEIRERCDMMLGRIIKLESRLDFKKGDNTCP